MRRRRTKPIKLDSLGRAQANAMRDSQDDQDIAHAAQDAITRLDSMDCRLSLSWTIHGHYLIKHVWNNYLA
jgi:hypothetical protein